MWARLHESLSEQSQFESMHTWLQRWFSWFYPGRENIWYRDFLRWEKFTYLPQDSLHEHAMFVGFASLALIMCGIILGWRSGWMRVLIAAVMIVFALTLYVDGGHSLWWHVYAFVPGAAAVRTLTRISLAVTVMLSFGLVFLLARVAGMRNAWVRIGLTLLLALTVMLEGRSDYWIYSPQESLARAQDVADKVDPTCPSFLYVALDDRPEYEKRITVLWAAIFSGVPTLNGYGHIQPPGWQFRGEIVTLNTNGPERDAAIARWQQQHPGMPAPCVVIDTAE